MKWTLPLLLIAFNANADIHETMKQYRQASVEIKDTVSDMFEKICKEQDLDAKLCKRWVDEAFIAGYKLGVMEEKYNQKVKENGKTN